MNSLLEVYNAQTSYAELGIITGVLKGLNSLYQVYHWRACGSEFYSDHLLFQRLYEGIQEELDTFGERTLGQSQDASSVNPVTLCKVECEFVKFCIEYSKSLNSNVGEDSSIATLIQAENLFIEILEFSLESLEAKQVLSVGTANLIEDTLDKHETNLYLLTQRAKSA